MKIKLSKLIINIVFIILIFQSALAIKLPGVLGNLFDYIDEFMACLALLYIIKEFICKYKLDFIEKKLLIIWIAIVIIGGIGTFVWGGQVVIAVLIDALECSKFILILVATYDWEKRKNIKSDLLFELNGMSAIIIYTFFILIITNLFIVELFPIGEYRFHIYTQQLMYGHPSTLADATIICIIILFNNIDKKKLNYIPIILGTVIVLSTTRTKGIASVCIIWFIFLYFDILKLKSKVIAIVFSIIVGIYIAYDSLELYFGGNTVTARGQLLVKGIQIANDFFPFGAGFGSYGSGITVNYYSPIYYLYDLRSIWGLGGDNMTFINDSFWPIILGQFGYIGILLFIILFIVLIKFISKTRKDSKEFRIGLSCVLYLLVISMGTTGIFGAMSQIAALILANCIYRIKKRGDLFD